MCPEFPVDLQDFLIWQGRSLAVGEVSDEEALVRGQAWKREHSHLLAKLAQVATKSLHILSFNPPSSAPAMDYLSAFVVRSLDVSSELFDLVTLKELPHPRPYLCQLGAIDMEGKPEHCRRYLELLVELGR